MLFFKLSNFYFFYFALLGAMAPYLGLYLSEKGMSLVEVGQLTAILMATKVFAPNLWGALADKTQKRLRLVRLGALLTLVGYLGFFWASSFLDYALVIIVFSFFWNAVLPQFEVITLHSLGPRHDKYSLIRLWGSVGFIVSVVLAGELFELFSLVLFPYILLFIITAILLSTALRYDEPTLDATQVRSKRGFKAELLAGKAYLLFVVCFLLQVSHAAYYTYFSLYLESLGYSKVQIGWLWGLGVAAEVLLFVYMHKWQAWMQLKQIMAIALVLTLVRWLLIAFFSDNPYVLSIAQCLHAFSFGAMHAVAIQFVHKHFSLQNQGKAQALYSSSGFGLGGAVGAMLCSFIVAFLGYEAAYVMSALTVLLALFCVFPIIVPARPIQK